MTTPQNDGSPEAEAHPEELQVLRAVPPPLGWTFAGIAGLSCDAEKMLHERGIICWCDFMRCGRVAVNPMKAAAVSEKLWELAGLWQRCDIAGLLDGLAPAGQLRMLPLLRRALFLDIETTGLMENAEVTVIGVYDGRELRQYVRGENLSRFPQEVPGTLITFNGNCFDLPILERSFPEWMRMVRAGYGSMDLLDCARGWGIGGGMKEIERGLGVGRTNEMLLCGEDAVRLWQEHKDGRRGALEQMLRYNAEDVLALERMGLELCNRSMNCNRLYRAYTFRAHPQWLSIPGVRSLRREDFDMS